jgi:small subunit ribosomal protein S7
MPRRREVPKREVMPDPRYGDKLVGKFINYLMKRGKRNIAESLLYKSFDIIGEKAKDDPVKVFKKAMDNVKPVLEVRSRRVGGATYQVPVEVRPDRKVALAMRWLIGYSKQRAGQSMVEKLAGEILDAYNNRGASVKKREDVHKMAEANKAFAHYRW